jgi:hypothetical protein
MRCDNCGWNNPEGLEKCQKCNQTLQPAIEQPAFVPETKVSPLPANDMSYKATTIDAGKFANSNVKENKTIECPKCSYPLATDTDICPNCGTNCNQNQETNVMNSRVDMKKTVLEFDIDAHTYSGLHNTRYTDKLTPLDNFDGSFKHIELDKAEVSVGKNELNGDRISNDVQTLFTNRDGKWFIRNSEDAPMMTFVSASHEIELRKGDIVVIGNVRYIFE